MKRRMSWVAVASAPLVLMVMPAISRADAPTPPWLNAVNAYRAEAGLAPVTEDPVLSARDQAHAQYMADTQTMEHFEDPSDPHYTAAGDQAAHSSNLAAGYWKTSADAVDDWMHAPFHAHGILDPNISAMGYAQALSSNGLIYSALDVSTDNNSTAPVSYPIVWPTAKSKPHILAYTGEYPDLASACPDSYETGPVDDVGGRSSDDGLPITIQLGPDAAVPAQITATFTSNGKALDDCVIDETSYTNTVQSSQDLGREILSDKHTIVVLPRLPLTPVTTYSLHLVAGPTTVDETFTTDRGSTSIDWQTLSTPRYDGEDVTVGGYLSSDAGSLPGKTVKILAGTAGSQRLVKTVTTQKDGLWETAVNPEGATTFQVEFPGDTTYLSTSSDPVAMTTSPWPATLTQHLSAANVARGKRITDTAVLVNGVNGSAVPAAVVALWARPSGGSWQQVATQRTTNQGRANFTYVVRKAAQLQLRAAATSTFPRYRAAESRLALVRAS